MPFVLVDGSDAPRITALDPVAEIAGLAVGETLADARARIGALEARRAEPAADAAALTRLAHWATRYTPSVALFKGADGNDGFFLDVTGATHLLGGEERLLADLARRLAAFGLPARCAIAETAGTAWATSRFVRKPRAIVTAGGEANALAPLPVEALRIAPETARTLRRLGFKRIGTLIGKARAPFAARFEKDLLRRLDQALGKTPEPFSLLTPPPVYALTRSLLEPISSEEAILIAATRLMEQIAPRLEADGAGARALRLALYRVDGAMEEIDIGLTLPTRCPSLVARLLRLKLAHMARGIEAGFGFETVRLAVTATERMEPGQQVFAERADKERERARRMTILHDALRQRLGPKSVRHLEPVASHWPERSEKLTSERSEKLTDERSEKLISERSEIAPPAQHLARPRPPLLLPRAEPATAIALVPDGPPQRLRWRGALHTIAHAEGPERIAAEWWRTHADAPTRDYYLVESTAGRRLWLYREGIPGRETAAPRWFVHGFFA